MKRIALTLTGLVLLGCAATMPPPEQRVEPRIGDLTLAYVNAYGRDKVLPLIRGGAMIMATQRRLPKGTKTAIVVSEIYANKGQKVKFEWWWRAGALEWKRDYKSSFKIKVTSRYGVPTRSTEVWSERGGLYSGEYRFEISLDSGQQKSLFFIVE